MKKVFLLLAAMMIMISSTCLASSYQLVEAEYTVQAGDSLVWPRIPTAPVN